jgi:hypothetical protein
MKADARVDIGVALGKCDCPLTVLEVRRRIDNGVDSSIQCSTDDIIAIAIELLRSDMCMRIYEHVRPEIPVKRK